MEFGDQLRDLLKEEPTTLPDQERWVGSAHVSWREVTPKVAHIQVRYGNAQDKQVAEWITAQELTAAGFRRAQFNMDTGEWQ